MPLRSTARGSIAVNHKSACGWSVRFLNPNRGYGTLVEVYADASGGSMMSMASPAPAVAVADRLHLERVPRLEADLLAETVVTQRLPRAGSRRRSGAAGLWSCAGLVQRLHGALELCLHHAVYHRTPF